MFGIVATGRFQKKKKKKNQLALAATRKMVASFMRGTIHIYLFADKNI